MWGLIALPLLGALAVRGRVRAPRRFGIWLLFILWVIASGVELSDSGRALAWAWRLSFYVAGAVVFLYFVNVPERRVSTRSIVPRTRDRSLTVRLMFSGGGFASGGKTHRQTIPCGNCFACSRAADSIAS
jgi:hypothetical protein